MANDWLGVLFVVLPVALGLLIQLLFVVIIVRAQRNPAARPRVFLPPVAPPPLSAPRVRCESCGKEFESGLESCPHCARGIPAPGEIDVGLWSASKVWLLVAGTAWPYLLGILFLLGWSLGDSLPWFGSFLLGSMLDLFFALVVPVGLATLIAYLVIATRSPIPSNMKTLWVVLLLFAGTVTEPLALYYLVLEPRRRLDSLIRSGPEQDGVPQRNRRA